MEGYFLAHCLGTKDHAEFSQTHVVYSIRDYFGIPHATILCEREGEQSPYGLCADLGTASYFKPRHLGNLRFEAALRVLQVRGRQDNLAMLPFLEIAQEWFLASGGPRVPFDKWNSQVEWLMDTDYAYHFMYLLDESKNMFTWSHRDKNKKFQAQLDGTSL